MTYTPLPINTVAVTELRLDLDNYRIPVRPADEAAALHHLFEAEDVLTAAKEILRDGYFDNEVPIVVKEESAYVVLEGNRRTSALKSLLDPKLVPSFEADVRALLRKYSVEAANLPSSIRVLVSPDRESAAPRIARLHTGTSKKKWSRDQQANFYYSLITPGTDVGDIKLMYPGVAVARFIRMASMRRFISAVPFSDKSLRDYAKSPQLTMSAFEYAYRNKELAAALGVEFDDDGLIMPASERPEKIGARLAPNFRSALEYLLAKFRSEGLNTRSPHFREGEDEQEDLLYTVAGIAWPDSTKDSQEEKSSAASSGSDVPNTSNAGSGASGKSRRPERNASEGDKSTSAVEDAPGDSPKSRGPNHPDTARKLDITGLDYGKVPVGLKRRYQELRKIDIMDLPVASATLLRLVFEGTIKIHFQLVKGAPISGMLSDVINSTASEYGKEKSIRTALNAIKSGSSTQCGSVNWFNSLSHDSDVTATGAEVRKAFDQISPVLRHLLTLIPQTGV